MGLVVCLDCAGTVSNEAEACVHCGKPLMEQPIDLVEIILMIAYTTYFVVSGLFIAFQCLGAFGRFVEADRAPDAMEVMIFLLWLISVSVSWIALRSTAKGPKVHRRLVVREREKSEK
jgi:hypothetical protein